MKKQLFLAAIALGAIVFGQNNTFPVSGYVGIGTTSPSAKLHVIGYAKFNPSLLQQTAGVFINPDDGSIELASGVNTLSYIDFKGKNNLSSDFKGRISYTDDWGFSFSKSGTDQVVIKDNGNMGIGTANPDEKLTVKGKIHAEEIKVDLAIPADYVFQKYFTGSSTLKPDYQMPSLTEIETFVKENHHLPNIPSASEIQQNGLQLGEMNNLLLQKVEELTLYIIEQNKRIEALEDKAVENN